MASMTSVISLLVLVLAAYCNASPVGDRDHTGTSSMPDYKLTTSRTMMGGEDKMNIHMGMQDQTTDVSHIYSEKHSDDKYTTMESDLKHHTRGESDEEEASDPFHSFSSNFDNEDTTMKSDDEFHSRRGESGEETSTDVDDDDTSESTLEQREFSESIDASKESEVGKTNHFMEHKSYTSEPSTSVDSFAHSTGFIGEGKSSKKDSYDYKPYPSTTGLELTSEYNKYESNDKSGEDILPKRESLYYTTYSPKMPVESTTSHHKHENNDKSSEEKSSDFKTRTEYETYTPETVSEKMYDSKFYIYQTSERSVTHAGEK